MNEFIYVPCGVCLFRFIQQLPYGWAGTFVFNELEFQVSRSEDKYPVRIITVQDLESAQLLLECEHTLHSVDPSAKTLSFCSI